MKHLFRHLVIVVFFFLVSGTAKVIAQSWDYLDVPQGYETLNLAVRGDTTLDGKPKSYNRVYRLERGGTYLLNGRISNVKDATLRVWAKDGTGAKPLIIMGVTSTGVSDDFAYALTHAHFKNLYISGTDMIGNPDRYTIAVYGDNTRIIFDGVEVDGSRQSHLRSYGSNQKIYVYNCVWGNSFDVATPSNGRFYDGRGLVQDSIVYQNNTFYVNTQRMFRTDGAITKNLVFDHNTFYLNAYGTYTSSGAKQGGAIETRRAVNAKITNNIFQDLTLEAMRYKKGIVPPDRMATAYVDSTGSATYPESSRNWEVKNNVYGWASEFKTFWAGIDTVMAPVFISPYGATTFFNKPNFVESGNFEEYIQFADAPKIDAMLAFVKHRFTSKFNNVGNPSPRADKNDVGPIEKPETFGPATDPYNFDYPKTQKAYYSGQKGFPIGDLNWFPTMKTLWAAGGSVGVEDINIIATEYELEQNYPNPFNPTTIISYSLPKLSKVSLTIYNAIGQEIVQLLNNKETMAGKHKITWNGKNANGIAIPSGVYFYQLKTDDIQLTRKMLLVK